MRETRGAGAPSEPSMLGIPPAARLLRRVRRRVDVPAVKKLVVDKALRALGRLPQLPRRGHVEIVVHGPNRISLTVVLSPDFARLDFGSPGDDGWCRLYSLEVEASGLIDEYGDFLSLLNMDDEFGRDWVRKVSATYDE